jgi:hypothetical protein
MIDPARPRRFDQMLLKAEGLKKYLTDDCFRSALDPSRLPPGSVFKKKIWHLNCYSEESMAVYREPCCARLTAFSKARNLQHKIDYYISMSAGVVAARIALG